MARALVVSGLLALSSCTGSIGEPRVPAAGEEAAGAPPRTAPVEDGAGALPLRRLTRREYVNTIRDLGLVDDADLVARDIPPDGRDVTSFEVAGTVTAVDIDRFLSVSEQIGQAVADRL